MKAIITATLLAVSISTFGQKGIENCSKYGKGKDSLVCIRNLSLYRNYVKQNNYTLALPYWKQVFDKCPMASKNIYIDGANMYKQFYVSTLTDERKAELLDTLMLIYDKRIEYFSDTAAARGRQGVDLLWAGGKTIANVKRAHAYLKESIEIEKKGSPAPVVINYFAASLKLYNNSILGSQSLIDDYLLVSSVIDPQIANKPTDTILLGVRKNLDNNFLEQGPEDCQKLIEYFSIIPASKKNDTVFLSMLTRILRSRNCISSSIFAEASNILYRLAPSSSSAYNIALLAYNEGNYSQSVNFFGKAVTDEKEEEKKADYYMGIAASYSGLKQKEKAREYAIKASVSRPKWGIPYIFIGELYAQSLNECSTITLPKAVYWAAVDKLVKAKLTDRAVEEIAEKKIETYSRYFPGKDEAFFQNITEGNIYLINCWINEKTIARF